MASLQRRVHKHSITWRVMAWDGPRQRSRTFAHHKGAEQFKNLVERYGWEYADQIRAQRVGNTTPTATPTVAQAVRDHVDALSGITDGTRSDYLKMADMIADTRLGQRPVDHVDEDTIAEWVREQRKHGLSAKTIANRHGLLYAAFRRQVKKGTIPGNPCEDIRIGRDEQVEMVILNADEFGRILDALKSHWRPFVITLAGTGLRFGEATALQVRDVDLDTDPPTLRIARAWKHTNGHGTQLGPPKSRRGRRTVALPTEVVTVLQPLVDGRPPRAYVFTNLRGQPIRQNSFHEIWTRAVIKSGITKRPRPHDLRHTYASWLIARGVPLPIIQRSLGHEQITTTISVYGHLAEDALSVTAQAASLALSPALPELEA